MKNEKLPASSQHDLTVNKEELFFLVIGARGGGGNMRVQHGGRVTDTLYF
jgi:hypothetical protein